MTVFNINHPNYAIIEVLNLMQLYQIRKRQQKQQEPEGSLYISEDLTSIPLTSPAHKSCISMARPLIRAKSAEGVS